MCNKISIGRKGFKYFIGYKDDENNASKNYWICKYMYVLFIKNDQLLKNTIKYGMNSSIILKK